MKCSRFVALLLLLAMALGVFAGCGTEGNPGGDVSGDAAEGASAENGDASEGSGEPSDEPEDGLRLPGKLTKLKDGYPQSYELSYEGDTFTMSSGGRVYYALRFGEDGRIAEKLSYDASGNVNDRVKYDYKDRKIMVSYYRSGYTYQTEEYTYDAEGKLIALDEYPNTTPERHFTYEYDANGNRTVIYETEDYGSGSSTKPRETWRYDAQNRMIEWWDGDDDYYQYEYDGVGRLHKSIYLVLGGVASYVLHEYDGDGNLLRETQYAPHYGPDGEDVAEYRTDYTYENGHLTLQTTVWTDPDDVWKELDSIPEHFARQTRYVYDEKGNRTERTLYNSDGNVTESYKASDFFRVDIAEEQYAEILAFLSAHGMELP